LGYPDRALYRPLALDRLLLVHLDNPFVALTAQTALT
jgi:hypothetical protein